MTGEINWETPAATNWLHTKHNWVLVKYPATAHATLHYSCFAVFIYSKAAIFASPPSSNAFDGEKDIHFPLEVHVRVPLRTNHFNVSIRFRNTFKPFKRSEVHISKWTKHGFWTWVHCGVLRETSERRNKRSIVREPFSSKQSTRQAAGEILGQLTLSFIDTVPACNQLNSLYTKPHWTHKAKRVIYEKTIEFGHTRIASFNYFFAHS